MMISSALRKGMLGAALALCGFGCRIDSVEASTMVQHYVGLRSVGRAERSAGLVAGGGYARSQAVELAYPAVLVVNPGSQWANYIAAAKAGVPYTIKTVKMVHHSEVSFSGGLLKHADVVQEGASSIQLRWPLLYDTPWSTWTLTIVYGTSSMFDDDGDGANPPAYVHVEQWIWCLDFDIDHLIALTDFFHNTSAGSGGHTLLSESFYVKAKSLIAGAKQAMECGDVVEEYMLLTDLELAIFDLRHSQMTQGPTASDTALSDTPANPVADRLLAELEALQSCGGLIDP